MSADRDIYGDGSMSLVEFDMEGYIRWRESVTEEAVDPTDPAVPIDQRDSDAPEFLVDPELSSTNTGFGGSDPALE